MKSVTKNKKPTDKSPFGRENPFKSKQNMRTEQSLVEDQYRRYSEMPAQQVAPKPKKKNRDSRMTNIKSEHPSRQRSLTPGSQTSSIYISECQNRYKQLEGIMKRQHDNITQQNIFLQNQIRVLYERETKYKQTIKRYKEQIKFLKLENDIYQQRYTEIKTYINSVVDRMAQLTIISEEQDDREMFRTSSLEMVAKLKEELSHYEDYEQDQKNYDDQCFSDIPEKVSYDIRNAQSQLVTQTHEVYHPSNYQYKTNNFIHSGPQIQQIVDLQETRFIKEPKYGLIKSEQHSSSGKKKSHKLPTFNKHQNEHYIVPYSSNDSSTPNSDSKTVDNSNFKPKNLLQDTSESNCLPAISQQIEQLTDQSQALMYELKKTNNQDSDIKKKIIRISQKIRELKIEANSVDEKQKFTSLQNIAQKQ